MKHFWNWIRNEDTGQRELWFEGVDLTHATVEIDWMRFEP